ncbi:SDR family NAD(P)-dependent oxidoreductase [Sphingosinicella terrae]|uniref:SDR family NAD(P)-dependent oxidoreductase n=1 Tax=Sphingosinicella terrae TaxID=2172047 RepID=UPI002547A6F6|nr:SDR family NAD(P)-dependent oxidoreductase [Sphingosinicella terrae]
MKAKPLAEQTIVINGGSSGIGLATARMAARRGHNGEIVSRDELGPGCIGEETSRVGGRADRVATDIGSRAEVRRAVETPISRQGSRGRRDRRRAHQLPAAPEAQGDQKPAKWSEAGERQAA